MSDNLSCRYGVSGFPTLMWFSADDKEPIKYESGRDLASFVAYINEKAGTHRTESGGLTDEVRSCLHYIQRAGFRLCRFRAFSSPECVCKDWRGHSTDISNYS